MLSCRLPQLNTISITYNEAAGKADLSPALTQLHQHAAGLGFLHLQLDRDWEHEPVWATLGGMVNLTRLELAFGSPAAIESAVSTGGPVYRHAERQLASCCIAFDVVGSGILSICWPLVSLVQLRTILAVHQRPWMEGQ
jgi:hypothetical protein